MPLVSTQEIKMELDCLSLIPSPSSFSPSSNGTKLEDEGFVELPIHITVTESQLQESESEFEWSENSPNLSICELIPSWRIIVSSLLHSPILYNCYNGDGLTKEELKWLDTGQYLVVRDFSRDGVAFDLIVCWNLMNEMCWDKNILVSGMQQKDSWSEWGEIKIVVRGAKNCEQNSGALRIHELVDCVSLYMMNFTCLAFAYDPGIYCMCWNESLVHFLKIQLDNSATSNHKIGLYGVKMVNNVSIFHNSLANPTVRLEDAMPLQEISSLHTVCCPTKHVTSREIQCKNRKKEMRWYLMALNGNLHYSDVFFKPSKHQLLKCVMNDGPSWSVKVLNSSEEKTVEQRHVLEVLDGVVLGVNPRRIADFQMSEMVVNDLCSSIDNSHDHGIACWFLKDSWGDVLVLEVNKLIRAAYEEQLKAEPSRRMMESFKSGVNEALYKLRADVGSSAQIILVGGNNLIAMFTGRYKVSFNNNSQIDKSNGSICSFVSQNNLLKCSRMNREKVLCIVTSKFNTLGLVGCNICWFQTICLVLCFENLSSVTPHARTRRICFYTFMELAVGKWLKDGNRTCLQIDSLPIARLCEICDGLFEMFPTWNKNWGRRNCWERECREREN